VYSTDPTKDPSPSVLRAPLLKMGSEEACEAPARQVAATMDERASCKAFMAISGWGEWERETDDARTVSRQEGDVGRPSTDGP